MNVFEQADIWWVIAFAVGIPLSLVVLTEIIGWLHQRGNPAVGPLRLLRNWVIPVSGLLVLLAFAIQSPADQVWVRVVATVFGLLLILLVLSGFNVALFANARSGSWRERTPKIFIEIARLILIIVGLALLFRFVWGADVGGVVAALGVTSIVIGLALQNAVGGVISGLLLLFEQPFQIGDWLTVGGVTGRVIEVNWRAVHLDTGTGVQVIPNSMLSAASFANLSQPAGPHRASIDVKFTTDDPPHDVVQLLMEVAESLPDKVPDQSTTVAYGGGGAYSVTVPLPGPAQVSSSMSLYRSWLWFAARRRGLALDGDSSDPIAEPGQLERALEVVAPTLHLGDSERELVLATSKLERYGAGEIVLRAGVRPDHIRFIVSGHASLLVEAAGGRIKFGSAEPGDYLGQTALTRERALSTAVAADPLTVLVVPLATLDTLVGSRPLLASEIGSSIELKRKAASEALATAGVARGLLTPR
jgi:small-conductance mechanosensitive channel